MHGVHELPADRLICSFHYSGAFNPEEARIRIMGIDEKVMTDYYSQKELNREDLLILFGCLLRGEGMGANKGDSR